MNRYFGTIGYGINVETYPGVWEEQIKEYEYYGNLVKNRVGIQQSTEANAELSMALSISIIADKFAYENFYAIRYITYLGKKWKVKSIEVEHPRLLLGVGELYNG